MEPSFFQFGQRSRCLFTPAAWCDLFNPASPVGTLDFLCNTTAQRVAVVLPSPPGDAGRLWDSVFERIAAVWEDRRIGFRCERVSVEAWTSQQPCAACTMVRTAQVVILEAQPGNQRAASFRDLALLSFGTLKSYKEAFKDDKLPNKKLVFISCGPALLPPHYSTLFDVLDYADASGRPDLDQLQRQMLAVARSATLFAPAPAISIRFDGAPDPNEKPRAAAPAAPSGVDIVILEQTAAEPAGAAAPADMGAAVREVISRVKVLDTVANPLSGRFEYKAVTEALKLIDESRFRDAILVLNGASEVEEPELRSVRKGMVMDCLDRMAPAEIVTELFAGDLLLKSVSLTGWSEASVAGATVLVATLTVWSVDLRDLIGNPVQVWLFDELRADEIRELGERLRRTRGTAAFLVSRSRSAEEVPVGVLVSQFSEAASPVHLIELRLDELKRLISDRAPVVEYLHLQVEEHLLDVSQLYSKNPERVVSRNGEFFGRQILIDRLIESLVNSDNFVVYGLRRAGKTSLVRRLELINKLEDHVIVVVDLYSPYPPENADELYYRVALAVRETLEKKYPPAKYPVSVFPMLDLKRFEFFRLDPKSPPGAFKNCFVKDLGDQLFELGSSSTLKFQKLILLFDEFQGIIPDAVTDYAGIAGHDDFLAQLRTLLNHSQLMVGMVGYGPVLEREFRNHNCHLYNQMQLLPLGMLTLEECAEMVRSLGGKRVAWTDDSIEAVFHASGGDPRLTKYLCAEILAVSPRSTSGRSVENDDVQRGIDSLLRDGTKKAKLLLDEFDFFALYFPNEAGWLEQIAKQTTLGQRTELGWEDGRQKLVDYGLLDADGTAGWLRSGLLHRALQERLRNFPRR
jgi:hypothetical protein